MEIYNKKIIMYNNFDNVLKDEILILNKTRPYYFEKEIWNEVKNINMQIAKLCKDIFLPFVDISWIAFTIKQELDYIADFSDNSQIYETSQWIKDLLDFYISTSEVCELYETSHNLNELYKILINELEFPN